MGADMFIPTFTVRDHVLYADGKQVLFRQTPNVGGACARRFLIMHFTAGSYAGAVDWLCNPAAKASAHLVIAEDGAVTQLARFDRATWHAGVSQWRGVTAMNTASIGMELANYGDMIEGAPGAYHVGRASIPDDRVMVAAHRHGGPRRPWHTYPAVQQETALAIAKALHAAYRFEDVAGHEDIAPGRKVDPGPAFPLSSFRAAVLGAPAALVEPEEVRPAPTGADRSPKALQAALNRLGASLVVDGDVGPASRAAIRAFQSAHGLVADGVAGPVTWAAIDAAIAEL